MLFADHCRMPLSFSLFYASPFWSTATQTSAIFEQLATHLPSPGVGKSSTSLHRLGLRRGVFACVGWQVLLCDRIWKATSRNSVMDFH